MKKGISLVALVITIIVLIIITGAIIVTVFNHDLFNKSEEAVFKQNMNVLVEELQSYNMNEKMKMQGNYNEKLLFANKNEIKYNEEVKEGNIFDVLKSLNNMPYADYIKIENGQIVFYGESEQQRQWAGSIIKLGDIVRILSIEELKEKVSTAIAPNSQINVSKNVVAIDAWGKSVNLDLWNYSFSSGTAKISYKGTIIDGKIDGEIPAYIKSGSTLYSVTDLEACFRSITTLIEAPYIPETVTGLFDTFYNCSGMTIPPVIPSSVRLLQGTFWGCTGLNGKTITINATSGTGYGYVFQYLSNITLEGNDEPFLSLVATSGTNTNVNYKKCIAKDNNGNVADINKWKLVLNTSGLASAKYRGAIVDGKAESEIPKTIEYKDKVYTVVDLTGCFKGRYKLVEIPTIPDTVTTLYDAFYNCSDMTTPPVIPSSVRNMQGAFWGCTGLKGKTMTVNATSGTVTAYAFYYVSGVKLEGPDETVLSGLAKSGTNITYTVTVE